MKYVCPMHSEETANSPGKCSKCGMDLVKKILQSKGGPLIFDSRRER